MPRYLDLETWPRRAQFEFFRPFELPWFALTAEVDVAPLRHAAREVGASFALAAWYAIYRAVNAVEAFRYRLRGDRVLVHDHLRVATTFSTGDETFAFVHLPAADDFPGFEAGAREALERARSRVGQPMDARPEDDAVVHGSTLPWLRFTAIQHARRLRNTDCVPKLAIGRATPVGDAVMMPLSVEAHHAVMDGVHVGRFFEEFGRLAAAPDWLGGAPGEERGR